MTLDDLDLDSFWDDSDYAREEYVDEPLTETLLASVEEELGVRLPRAYVELMRAQNGGIPKNRCSPTDRPTSWAEDHVAITGIMGIGRGKTYSILGLLGSPFMQEEWGYPTWGVCICGTPAAGHDMVMLDYRGCGPDGEPGVVHVDQESGFEVTPLAPDFGAFVRGLVHESEYDDSEKLLAEALETLRSGQFSTGLRALLAATSDPGTTERAFRNLLAAIARENGCLVLRTDEASLLVYDVLFVLQAGDGPVPSQLGFCEAFRALLAFGDGDVNLGAYVHDKLVDWWDRRTTAGDIEVAGDGWAPTPAFRAAVLAQLGTYS